MKFALACYGTRGDVEPSVGVASELLRRGHQVRLAVPPDLVDFAEAAGLDSVAYGPKLQDFLHEEFLRNSWNRLLRSPISALRELWAPIVGHWADTSATLLALAQDCDLLSTSINYEQPAANVAEYYGIPLIALHHFPMRPNAALIPMLPGPLVRFGGTLSERLLWRATRGVENLQRSQLGLARATRPSPHRLAERGELEIQAYDAVSVPGLAAEWANYADRRPFVGALTMSLPTAADQEVRSWIEAGSAPICFAFGSIPVESPAQMLTMIATACARLGERGLVCAGGTDLGDAAIPPFIKVASAVNYADIFPRCRAIVHHGGSGTTAASLRAGIPTLILWSTADQPYWGNQLDRLGVGAARRFSHVTDITLTADLRKILTAGCDSRARQLATRMTTADDSVRLAADLFEQSVRARRER